MQFPSHSVFICFELEFAESLASDFSCCLEYYSLQIYFLDLCSRINFPGCWNLREAERQSHFSSDLEFTHLPKDQNRSETCSPLVYDQMSGVRTATVQAIAHRRLPASNFTFYLY